MKKLFFILCIFSSFNLIGQEKRDFGLNLWTTTYDLYKQEEPRWITLDIFYKKYNETNNTTNRWSANISKIMWLGDTYWDTLIVINNNDLFTGYTIIGNIGVKKGIEKYYDWNNLQFYFGTDIGLQTIFGYAYQSREITLYRDKYQYNLDVLLSVTPFTGIRIPLSKRLYFTAELGLELGVLLENRPFFTTETNVETIRQRLFYMPWRARYGVNNIGFSYRF